MSNLQTLASQSYRENQIKSATPLDLVIMAYDAALAGCGQQDLERTTKAISILRNALDFNYNADIALGFFRIYQYCADLIRNGEFDEAAHLLRELRGTWAEARDQQQAQQQPASKNNAYNASQSPYTARQASSAGATSHLLGALI